MADVFSNPSNDYIYPGLSPCPNIADDQYLTWVPDGLAIVLGTTEISKINFEDLYILVNSFNKQQIILREREVTFIPGLTKGLDTRREGFNLPNENIDPFYVKIDLSINYYKDFSLQYSNIEAITDPIQNIDIESALNYIFSEEGIEVSATLDTSTLIFTGNRDGYEFNISDVILTTLDASLEDVSTFTLEKNDSYDVASVKYPNTAMQGIILKAIYSITDESQQWVYLNHVPNKITLYNQVENLDCSIYYDKVEKKIDVGMSGTSTNDIMSAGDYLHWVSLNDKWKKVGEMYVWITAPDNNFDKNLLEGFYVYNPHSAPVKIEYMVIV